MSTLSVVAPLYNEEGNVAELVRRLRAAADGAPGIHAYELVLVDDGSTDRTAELLLGLDLGPAQVDRGSAFVDGVVERAGEEGLARLWSELQTLPTPAEVDAPGLWLERINLG